MFGKYNQNGKLIPAPLELVRLAIPRRVYTQSHIDYVAEVIIEVFQKRNEIKGLRIIEEAPLLRHFTAKLQPA
jgi:tryptophanase